MRVPRNDEARQFEKHPNLFHYDNLLTKNN